MKITKQKLNKIIKEEIQAVRESWGGSGNPFVSSSPSAPTQSDPARTKRYSDMLAKFVNILADWNDPAAETKAADLQKKIQSAPLPDPIKEKMTAVIRASWKLRSSPASATSQKAFSSAFKEYTNAKNGMAGLEEAIASALRTEMTEGWMDKAKSALGFGDESKPAAAAKPKSEPAPKPKAKSQEELRNDIVLAMGAFDRESPLDQPAKMSAMRSMLNDAIAQLPAVQKGAEPKIKTTGMSGAHEDLAYDLEDFIQEVPGLRSGKFELETLAKKFLEPRKRQVRRPADLSGFGPGKRITGAGRTKSFDI